MTNRVTFDADLIAKHIAEIDAWNESMAKVIGKPVGYRWESLELIREQLAQSLKDDNPEPKAGPVVMLPARKEERLIFGLPLTQNAAYNQALDDVAELNQAPVYSVAAARLEKVRALLKPEPAAGSQHHHVLSFWSDYEDFDQALDALTTNQ
jgi:hypothetical protein